MESVYWFLIIIGILGSLVLGVGLFIYGSKQVKKKNAKIQQYNNQIDKVNAQLDMSEEMLNTLDEPIQKTHDIFSSINQTMEEEGY